MCTKAMSHIVHVAALSVLLCFSARAQEVEVGTGIVCDTQKQMERFVALFHGDTEAAVEAVMTSLSRMAALLAVRCGAAGLLSAVHPIRALQILFDPYRPELHYMRGPGPKWHAKHDPAPVLR